MYGVGQCFGALSGAILRKALGLQHALEVMSLIYIALGVFGIIQMIVARRQAE